MDDLHTYNEKSTILVVDDAPENLTLMAGLLKDDYRVKVANNGEKALAIARSEPQPDLILLDIMMPGMDGYEVCRRLKEDIATSQIPVIFLTARTDVADETHGLEMGAEDYILKPVSPPIVLARVKTHLHLKEAADFLRDNNLYLMQQVEKRTTEVRSIQEVTILALASLAETRDNDTGNHLRRTQLYAKALALKLNEHPRFREFLSYTNIDMLYKSAPLHDIGKVGIPDRILLKPGKLEPEEFEIMKQHSLIGRDAIEQAEHSLGAKVEFLRIAKEIVLYHHEKWDGSGYPEGLAGDDIPAYARLMAVADFYDALVSRRIYRPGFPHEKVVQMILEGKGTHFDPDVVDAFIDLQDEFREIANKYIDTDADLAKKC